MPQQKETLADSALRELAWYRVLTLRQILLLSGCTSERWAREQLRLLEEKAYVYIRTPHLSKGRLPRVYQLLPKGKTYLKKRGIDVPYYVLSLKDLEEAEEKKIFPDHTIGVNDVFIMLHVLTVHYPDRFQLLTRIHEREMSHYVTRRDGGVEPDGFFSVQITQSNRIKKQSCFLEYERTSAFADMEKFKDRIRGYVVLFDNVTKLETLFGVKTPYLLTVCNTDDRAKILTTYCARVLQDCGRTDWESRFLFSSLETTVTPLQFFCSSRWLRSWLPIPPAVPYFTDQEDLLQPVS